MFCLLQRLTCRFNFIVLHVESFPLSAFHLYQDISQPTRFKESNLKEENFFFLKIGISTNLQKKINQPHQLSTTRQPL